MTRLSAAMFRCIHLWPCRRPSQVEPELRVAVGGPDERRDDRLHGGLRGEVRLPRRPAEQHAEYPAEGPAAQLTDGLLHRREHTTRCTVMSPHALRAIGQFSTHCF